MDMAGSGRDLNFSAWVLGFRALYGRSSIVGSPIASIHKSIVIIGNLSSTCRESGFQLTLNPKALNPYIEPFIGPLKEP